MLLMDVGRGYAALDLILGALVGYVVAVLLQEGAAPRFPAIGAIAGFVLGAVVMPWRAGSWMDLLAAAGVIFLPAGALAGAVVGRLLARRAGARTPIVT